MRCAAGGVRQAVAVLAHIARPAAFCLAPYSRRRITSCASVSAQSSLGPANALGIQCNTAGRPPATISAPVVHCTQRRRRCEPRVARARHRTACTTSRRRSPWRARTTILEKAKDTRRRSRVRRAGVEGPGRPAAPSRNMRRRKTTGTALRVQKALVAAGHRSRPAAGMVARTADVARRLVSTV